MSNMIYEMTLEGAREEGKRLREAVEAAGGKDRPIDACPGENEQYFLEIDFRDGEVSLRNWWGGGRPEFICKGDGAWLEVDPSTSHLALADLLEHKPERVAEFASVKGSAEDFENTDLLSADIDELGRFWVMDENECFDSSTITGNETDKDLSKIAADRSLEKNGVFLTFTEDEALEWLKECREEAREELDDAA